MPAFDAKIKPWPHCFRTVEKTSYLKEDVSPDMLQTMKDSCSQAGRTMQQRTVQENDGVPRVAPKWLKHDR